MSLGHLQPGRERQHEGTALALEQWGRGTVMRDWDRIWPVGCLGMVVIVAIIDMVTRAVD